MNRDIQRFWVRFVLAGFALLASGCAVTSQITAAIPRSSDDNPAAPSARAKIPAEYMEIDQDLTELQAVMRHDLVIHSRRLAEQPAPKVVVATSEEAEELPTPVSRHLEISSADGLLRSIEMPVVGVRPEDLENSFGAPRDGGRRRHRGIDIFAPRGSKAVATVDGEISFIGTERKAGKCLWLVSDQGVSFFYAHLDHWPKDLYEGKKVKAGDVIGFVGSTGNAKRSGPHLHFAIHRDSQAVNPYPYLVNSTRIAQGGGSPLSGGFTSAGAQ